jgi:hypothetical protein
MIAGMLPGATYNAKTPPVEAGHGSKNLFMDRGKCVINPANADVGAMLSPVKRRLFHHYPGLRRDLF